MNIITQSGGDSFHGSLFEFWRNNILNANDFLTNASTNPPFGRGSNGKAKRAPFDTTTSVARLAVQSISQFRRGEWQHVHQAEKNVLLLL